MEGQKAVEGQKEPPDLGFQAEKYPCEFPINDRLKVRVGYRDCRIVISWNTRIPLVGWQDLELGRDDIPLVERVLAAQRAWSTLSKGGGGRKASAVTKLKMSDRTTARVGYEDRHVEIAVSLLLIDYVIALAEADAPRIEEALAFARKWNEIAEIERFIKGAD